MNSLIQQLTFSDSGTTATPRILLVDDDPALLDALPQTLRLRMSPIAIDAVESARHALEFVAEVDYDAIVTDIKMPGMDGLALLREIRAIRPVTPTLLITGHGEHDLAVQALRGGAYDFIQKPIDREYIVAALRRAIEHRNLIRKIDEQRGELETYAAHLESLVEQRTGQLAEANERLRRAMTETHHRVKNNLQLISALLDIEIMAHKKTVSVQELRRLSSYVATLAAVHDLLTQESKKDERAQTISGKAVLEHLLALMQHAAGHHSIRLELDDIRLSPQQGTSLALVTHELVSNAIKHGNNNLEVQLRVSNNSAVLEVHDDGPGFPPGFDPGSMASTGLELVERLSKWDLSGDLEFGVGPNGGGRVIVGFPIGPAATAGEGCETTSNLPTRTAVSAAVYASSEVHPRAT